MPNDSAVGAPLLAFSRGRYGAAPPHADWNYGLYLSSSSTRGCPGRWEVRHGYTRHSWPHRVARVPWTDRTMSTEGSVWSQEAMVKYARRPITACMPAFSKKYEMRVLRRTQTVNRCSRSGLSHSMDILSSNRVDCTFLQHTRDFRDTPWVGCRAGPKSWRNSGHVSFGMSFPSPRFSFLGIPKV